MNFHKYYAISCVSLAASIVALVSFSTPDIASAQGYKTCTSLHGNWAWDQRAFLAHLSPDDPEGTQGRITATDQGQTISAIWECDNRTKRANVYWSTGYVDSLLVSNTALIGENNAGQKIVVIRRADGDSSLSTNAPNGGCPDNIIGNWAWDRRAFPATILSNIVIGNDGGQFIAGEWTCLDPVTGKIQVDWLTGYTDTLELSRNGNFLTGVNNTGYRLSVVRREH